MRSKFYQLHILRAVLIQVPLWMVQEKDSLCAGKVSDADRVSFGAWLKNI